MIAYLKGGSAQTNLPAATLRSKLQIQLSTSSSHSILTTGRPVPALTLERRDPGWVAAGEPIFFKVTGMTRPGKGASGSRTQVCRSRGGRLSHRANETVRRDVAVCCLTSQQHASVSLGRICSDYFTCCHSEIEVADPTFHLTQSQYTDTGPTSPNTDPITPGAWQGSHWNANF